MGDVLYFSKYLSLCLVWSCIGGAAACTVCVPCTIQIEGVCNTCTLYSDPARDFTPFQEPAMIKCVKWLNLGRPPLWFTYENVRTAFLATET